MANPRLKIAYLCDFSPLDPHMYSGGNRRMHDALQQHVGDVTILPQGWGLAEPLRRAIARMPLHMALRLRWRAHLALAPLIARKVETELKRDRYDVLFTTYAFHALSRVSPPYPMLTAFTSDATQTIYRNSEIGRAHPSRYPGGRLLDAWVESREREVFRNTDLLLWPSRWIKDEADALYGLDPDRSLEVPWGAGLKDAPPETTVPPLGRDHPLELLIVGRDWFAKGGATAFATMTALRARGIDARLTVIGCVPPDELGSDHVTVHPQLDKTVPAELALFDDAFRRAHFLVQPSYESYGFAFCEASAHALPALCLDVGGVPVRDGINGHALAPGSEATAFANLIETYIDAPERYRALAHTARREFDTRLNWDAWGRTVAGSLHAALAKRDGTTQAEPPCSGSCPGPMVHPAE